MPQAVKANNARVTTRILVVFGLTFLAVLALILIQRLLATPATYQQTEQAIFICMLVSAGLAVVSLLFSLVLTARSHARTGLAWAVTFLLVLLSGSCLMLRLYYIDAVTVLNPIMLGLAVLYLVYLVFQREFFSQAMMSAICAVGLFAVSRLFGRGQTIVAYIGLILLCAALVGFTLLVLPALKKDKGRLRMFGHTFALAHPKTPYDAFWVTTVVLAVALLASAICGIISTSVGYIGAHWAMLAVIGYLFILAVYYTVKLMVTD